MLTFSAVVRLTLCIVGAASFIASIFMLKALENEYAALPTQHRQAYAYDGNGSIPDTSTVEASWPHPFIHIINTRFMQHQADLIHLARARLALFETFCLSSIVGQSLLQATETPSFLWIIKTDPDLDASLVKELVSLIEPYPFIYLVASNVNYGIGVNRGGWRGGEAGEDVLRSRIYSGNMTLLRQAHASRDRRAILETRLDADDGLQRHFLEVIQAEALELLRYDSSMTHQQRRQDWMYWCHINHLDWTPSLQFSDSGSEYGTFAPYQSAHLCITAGITMGASVAVAETNIPRFMHHQIYQELGTNRTIPTCGGETCLHMLDKPIIGSIRSRTATSAGMRGVKMKADRKAIEHAVAITDTHLINSLRYGFHVPISKMAQLNKYMRDNIYAIAADNLRGQCTHGHSCKNSTREALEELLSGTKNYTNTSMLG